MQQTPFLHLIRLFYEKYVKYTWQKVTLANENYSNKWFLSLVCAWSLKSNWSRAQKNLLRLLWRFLFSKWLAAFGKSLSIKACIPFRLTNKAMAMLTNHLYAQMVRNQANHKTCFWVWGAKMWCYRQFYFYGKQGNTWKN